MMNNKKIIIFAISIGVIAFLLYSLFIPSSQVFWRTTTHSSTGDVLYTFDDGPGAQTPAILDVLKEHNVTAIFFINCAHINSTENEVLIRIVQEGHSIGVHGYEHRINEDYQTLKSCKDLLENITGEPVLYFRPPYGFRAPRTMSAAKDLNMTVMMWSVFPRDYSAKSADVIVKRVSSKLRNDSIVCLHDGPANREFTVDALKRII